MPWFLPQHHLTWTVRQFAKSQQANFRTTIFRYQLLVDIILLLKLGDWDPWPHCLIINGDETWYSSRRYTEHICRTLFLLKVKRSRHTHFRTSKNGTVVIPNARTLRHNSGSIEAICLMNCAILGSSSERRSSLVSGFVIRFKSRKNLPGVHQRSYARVPLLKPNFSQARSFFVVSLPY